MSAIIYLLAISAAELVTAAVNPLSGIVFHLSIFIALIVHSSLGFQHPRHRLYLTLALAPLIRILSLSMPLANFPQVYWYLIIAIPVIAATIVVIRLLNYRPTDIGFTPGKIPVQLLIAATGFAFGVAEYLILRPAPLAASLTPQNIWLAALILLVATGFVEEFAFRGVMQRCSLETMGPWGLIYVAGVFAALHIGYLSAADVIFVFSVGLLFGWIVKKTGSLLGVTLSHGLTNIVLYLVVPFLF